MNIANELRISFLSHTTAIIETDETKDKIKSFHLNCWIICQCKTDITQNISYSSKV
jgi:hypothetical protein